MRGAFGETDLDTGRIRINRQKHFSGRYDLYPTKDPKKALALTVKHELTHLEHPRMTEKKVRKLERKSAHTMTSQEQKRLLAKLKSHGRRTA